MFVELAELLSSGQYLTINVIKEGEKLNVIIHPQQSGSEIADKLEPFHIKTTPGKMDEVFLQYLKEPLKETIEVLSNVDGYRQSLSKATGTKTAVSDRIKSLLTQAEIYDKNKQVEKSFEAYTEILKLDLKHVKANERIKELEMAKRQKNIFDSSPKKEGELELIDESTEKTGETVSPPVKETPQEVKEPVAPQKEVQKVFVVQSGGTASKKEEKVPQTASASPFSSSGDSYEDLFKIS